MACECWRHCLQKGAWSRLLSEPQAWFKSKGWLEEDSELPGEEAFTPHPLWRALARSLNYELVFSSRVRASTHINLKELHGYLRLEERIGNAMVNVRFLCGLDSQVCLGALCKGRAASPAINRCLRRSLAYHLGCNLYGGLGYFRSCENPADDPTREVPLRRASEPPPAWWIPLAKGDPEPFDLWLGACQALKPDPSKFHPGALSEKLGPQLKHGGKPFEAGRPRAPKDRLQPPRCNGLQKRKMRRAARLGAKGATGVPSPPFGLGPSSLGLEVFPRGWFWPPRGELDFGKPGALLWDCAEAGWGRRLVKAGIPWVLQVPRLEGRAEGFVADACKALLETKACLLFGAMPAVGSFSQAVTPPCRSRAQPFGLKEGGRASPPRLRLDNARAALLDELLRVARSSSGVSFWVVHPDGSHLWNLPASEGYGRDSLEVFRVDSCRFGTPWRKRLRIATNTRLAGMRAFCQCGRGHLRLRGRTGVNDESWTRAAGACPTRLSDELCSAAGSRWRQVALPSCRQHR